MSLKTNVPMNRRMYESRNYIHYYVRVSFVDILGHVHYSGHGTADEQKLTGLLLEIYAVLLV